MERRLSFLIVLVLILTSFGFSFGADFVPEDVKDTKYEEAVIDLIEKGIISGYPDGTFKPNNPISRAEACMVVIKSMNPSEENLQGAEKNSFTDLEGYDWAAEYINYAQSKGIVSGYSKESFKPAGDVTYAEMASMLVRALGHKTADLSGTWPENFVNKAIELGIFKDIEYGANKAAFRGDVALMTGRVADDIKASNETGEDGENENDTDEPGKDPADPLADFNGRAYGILLDVARVLNEKGNEVDEYKFLLGKNTLFLKTDGRVSSDETGEINEHLGNGELYGLQMSGGVIKKIATSSDGFTGIFSGAASDKFEDFAITKWERVKSAKNNVIEMIDTFNGRNAFTVLEDASIYVAEEKNGVITGYKAGTMNDIKADSLVRLYSVTGQTPGVVEIVMVNK